MKLRPQFMWTIRERVWTMTPDVADVLLSLTHRLHIYSSSLLDNQRASMSYCLSHTAYTFTPHLYWTIRERVWTMTPDVADVLLSLTHRLHIYSSSLLDNQRASMSYCLSHTAYTFTPHLYWTIRERVWTMTPDVADVLLSLTHRLHIYSSSLLDNQRASMSYCLSHTAYTFTPHLYWTIRERVWTMTPDVADVLLSLTNRLHIYSSFLLDNQRASMSYCLSHTAYTFTPHLYWTIRERVWTMTPDVADVLLSLTHRLHIYSSSLLDNQRAGMGNDTRYDADDLLSRTHRLHIYSSSLLDNHIASVDNDTRCHRCLPMSYCLSHTAYTFTPYLYWTIRERVWTMTPDVADVLLSLTHRLHIYSSSLLDNHIASMDNDTRCRRCLTVSHTPLTHLLFISTRQSHSDLHIYSSSLLDNHIASMDNDRCRVSYLWTMTPDVLLSLAHRLHIYTSSLLDNHIASMDNDIDVLLSLTHRLHIYSSSPLDDHIASVDNDTRCRRCLTMSYCLSHTAYTFTPHLYWTIRERVWTMTPDVADVLLCLTHRLHIYSSSLLDNHIANVADDLLSRTHRLHIYSSSLLDNHRASMDNDTRCRRCLTRVWTMTPDVADVLLSLTHRLHIYSSSLLDNHIASMENDTRCRRCLTRVWTMTPDVADVLLSLTHRLHIYSSSLLDNHIASMTYCLAHTAYIFTPHLYWTIRERMTYCLSLTAYTFTPHLYWTIRERVWAMTPDVADVLLSLTHRLHISYTFIPHLYWTIRERVWTMTPDVADVLLSLTNRLHIYSSSILDNQRASVDNDTRCRRCLTISHTPLTHFLHIYSSSLLDNQRAGVDNDTRCRRCLTVSHTPLTHLLLISTGQSESECGQ
ncbi:hypothetical protein J6590_083093 [Homalodisca vitripennis]|nr:hypothetical protein J6590_083093 [Homalodisca vitripennis]